MARNDGIDRTSARNVNLTAAKIENALNKMEGVNRASVSFMTQKLTIQADDARFDAVVQEAVKACKKVEPDCEIVLK